jgi:hypothetical protein
LKNVLIGLWLTVVALGAAFGSALMASTPPPKDAHGAGEAVHAQQTRTMNVPIIVDGALQGYVGMQFSYVVDAAAAKSIAVTPEIYLLNTAFSAVYMDTATDFRHLERMDIPAFTKRLVAETNAHLGAPVIKDVMIEAFNYIPKDVQPN